MAEVFELHDREAFEIFVYYCGIERDDPLKTRIRESVEHWADVRGWGDEAVAAKIAADQIDILVDLNAYTRDALVRVFAARPAPVIVNWLGYPGTTGSPYHHYIIADDWIIPESHTLYYSEKVMRLSCYQPNDRKRFVAPERPSRTECGLPEEAMVFCCFNGLHKLSRFTFERWMRILGRVPDSVLWLLANEEPTMERLREVAGTFGVSADRLVFAQTAPNPQHLARYPLADLFLDTAPYGAHTTASDALWMGVPILTLSGRSFASRVCGSLARAAGVPELVCATPEEYVERAVDLGNDRARIAHYKERLAAGRSTCVMFDMNSHIRQLEGLYHQMWSDFVEKRLPRPDLSNLSMYLAVGGEGDHETVEVLARDDYHEWYRQRMAQYHRHRPLRDDHRVWTAADIRQAEEGWDAEENAAS